MFCPKCGQTQHSDEVRFCPRCGFSLAGVGALLAADGAAVTAGRDVPHADARAGRQAGIRHGGKIMFFSIILAPLFLAVCFLFDSPVPLFVPVTVFLAGLAWLLYAVLFGDELLPVQSIMARRGLRVGRDNPALGAPPPFVPASGFNPLRVNTAELAKPPSVTEHTTKLLDKD